MFGRDLRKTPLCSVACQNIISEVLKENSLEEGISCIVTGNYEVGEMMTNDSRIPLISATGSSKMGQIVGATVAGRFGKSLLELGGNNAIIITPTADLKNCYSWSCFRGCRNMWSTMYIYKALNHS